MNDNALSYWFPKIESAGVPVPKTVIVEMPSDVHDAIYGGMNGERSQQPPDPQRFYCVIDAAAQAVGGYPCFLRTDHTSAKHSWQRACFLPSAEAIPAHVYEIAEYSELSSFLGDLDWHRWAVRELLPTVRYGTCLDYGDMPVSREFRFFVDDGAIRCWHPYWPQDALAEGAAMFDRGRNIEALNDLDAAELDQITPIIEAAGRAVCGSWSVDILQVARPETPWMVTDMALAADSFHWDGCPLGGDVG